jgi:hypothetical protein
MINAINAGTIKKRKIEMMLGPRRIFLVTTKALTPASTTDEWCLITVSRSCFSVKAGVAPA